jgi:uncharacterized ion transporter superfamily protein YfcC
MNSISNWFLRLAVLYLIAGVLLGIIMAASGNHTMHACTRTSTSLAG